MKLRIQLQKGLFYYLIVGIFALLYLFAMSQIMYWQTNRTDTWAQLYKIAQFGMLLLCCIYFAAHVIKFRNVNLFCCLVNLYLIYETLVSIIFKLYAPGSLFRDGYLWPLVFVVFYLYSEKYEIPPLIKKMLIWGTVACMMLLINNIRIHLTGDGLAGGVIGVVYFCLGFLGLILHLGFKREKVIFSILTTIMLLISAKRAGVLCVIIGLCLYYLVGIRIENKLTKRVKRLLGFSLVGLVAVCVGLWFISKYELSILERFLNAADDQGSGRIEAWEKVLSYYNDSNFINQMLGHGFHAVPYEVKPLGKTIYAHNSYLETLYDLGWLGLTWLLLMIMYLITKLVGFIKLKRYFAPQLAYSMVNIIILSMLGYFFDESRFILPFAMLWGVCLGNEKRQYNISNAGGR